jgi:hypothetical protein
MKTRITIYAWFCLLAGFYTACNSNTGTAHYAVGTAGELLVVISNPLWKSACGDSLRHYFTKPVEGMPAPEPTFSLSQQVELTSFMQKFRNILIVNVDPAFAKAKLGHKVDVYAKNQLIFNLDAPSADSAIACADRNKDLIIARFLAKDRDAAIDGFKKNVADSSVNKVREKFQADIVIPKPFTLDVEKDDFVWIAREEGEKNWHLLMWKEPYMRKTQLAPDSLIEKMNTMTRKYVPGPTEGSYMATEPSVPPIVKIFEKDGVYCVQMNGLWQTENSYMGGPYVCQTIIDTRRGQLVSALGFVFYPNRDKRQMIWQLEAMLHTMMPSGDQPTVVAVPK